MPVIAGDVGVDAIGAAAAGVDAIGAEAATAAAGDEGNGGVPPAPPLLLLAPLIASRFCNILANAAAEYVGVCCCSTDEPTGGRVVAIEADRKSVV